MQFCTSCGEKIPPGSKFCENCGAPVGKPEGTPEPELSGLPTTPGPAPAPVPKRPALPVIVIVGAVILLVAAAVVIAGLPYLEKNQGSDDVIVPTITLTPTPALVETTIVIDTPLPTTKPPTPVIRTEGRYEEDYEEIYTLNRQFNYGESAPPFSYLLTRPPLYVKFNLTPVMITRHRMVDIGLSSEHMVNTTNPSPNAWFEIRILDAGTGAVIDQQGYGNDYSDMTKQEFMVRQPGNYTVEISGRDITADIQILIGT